MTEYRLTIKSLNGKILTYHVKEYEVNEGYVEFYDLKDKVRKKYPTQNVEITEVQHGN